MKIDVFTRKSKEYNEDDYGFTKTMFWVIDGATPRISNMFDKVGYNSNAEWFAKTLSKNLYRTYDETKSLIKIIRNALHLTREDFEETIGRPVTDFDEVYLPGGSISIVKVSNNKTEIVVIGDTLAIVEFDGKIIWYSGDKAHKNADKEIIEYKLQLMQSSMPENEREEKISEFILNIRKKLQNKEGGYPELNVSYTAEEFIFDKKNYFEHIHKGNPKRFLLASDGLYSLVDTYRVYNSYYELLDAVRISGVKKLVNMVKTYSTLYDILTIPRIKVFDDTTGLYVEFDNCLLE